MASAQRRTNEKLARERAKNGELNPWTGTFDKERAAHWRKIPWDFIGVDGEGSTRRNITPDGIYGEFPEKSVYQILAAYHPDIEPASLCVEQASGLGTVACLDFLLSLRLREKRLAICGYGFSYDISCMLADIPWPKLQELAKDKPIHFHSGGKHYKIRVIYKKLLEVWRWQWKDGKRERDYVRVYDAFGFFQCSFAQAIKQWKVGTPEELAFIEQYKSRRGEPLLNDWENWKKYNAIECRLLRELMLRLNEMMEAEDIHLTSWWGAGSIAGYWYSKSNVAAHLVQDYGKEINRDVFYAYFGGQIQHFYKGFFDSAVFHYDLNSAYPWACARLPDLTGGWQTVAGYDADAEWALYEVEYDFRSVWHDTHYGPFPWRGKNGAIYYPRQGRGIFWSPEVRAVLHHWPHCIKIRRGRVLLGDTGNRPFDWVSGLFDRRNKLKQENDPRNIVLKLGLNSLYGKMAQGEGAKSEDGTARIPRYQSYVWAGLITSQTRARMIDAVAADPSAIVAIATDGLFSLRPLPLQFGTGLGEWTEEETLDWFEIYSNGVYRGQYHGGNGEAKLLQRARGFQDRSFPFAELRTDFYRRGVGAYIDVPIRRFRGYKLACHRNSPDLLATWGEDSVQCRVITASPVRPFETLPNGNLRVESVYHSYEKNGALPDFLFPEPYRPRQEFLATLPERLLDESLLDLAESPD